MNDLVGVDCIQLVASCYSQLDILCAQCVLTVPRSWNWVGSCWVRVRIGSDAYVYADADGYANTLQVRRVSVSLICMHCFHISLRIIYLFDPHKKT